jgi:hypothetical protein
MQEKIIYPKLSYEIVGAALLFLILLGMDSVKSIINWRSRKNLK